MICKSFVACVGFSEADTEDDDKHSNGEKPSEKGYESISLCVVMDSSHNVYVCCQKEWCKAQCKENGKSAVFFFYKISYDKNNGKHSLGNKQSE